MKCPYCQLDNDKVIDSRTCEDGFATRRRRQCNKCMRRYTTFERLVEIDIKVVKKNGARQPFDPNKIRTGLQRACWKRPVSDEQIESAVMQIEQEIYQKFDGEISSDELGQIAIRAVAKLDEIAYVRFASVYLEFKEVQDFVEAVEKYAPSSTS